MSRTRGLLLAAGAVAGAAAGVAAGVVAGVVIGVAAGAGYRAIAAVRHRRNGAHAAQHAHGHPDQRSVPFDRPSRDVTGQPAGRTLACDPARR